MMVRKERLELSRLAALEPKSSASTNSATFAGCYSGKGRIIAHYALAENLHIKAIMQGYWLTRLTEAM